MDFIRPIIQFFRDVYRLVIHTEDAPTETSWNTDLELGQVREPSTNSELRSPLCDIVAKLNEFHASGLHIPPNQIFQTAEQDDASKRVREILDNASANYQAFINLVKDQKPGHPCDHDLISLGFSNCPQCRPGSEMVVICLVPKNEQSDKRNCVVLEAKPGFLFPILRCNEEWFRSYCKLFPKSNLPQLTKVQTYDIFKFADPELANDLWSRGLSLEAHYDVAWKAVTLQKNPDPMLDWLREHGPRDNGLNHYGETQQGTLEIPHCMISTSD